MQQIDQEERRSLSCMIAYWATNGLPDAQPDALIEFGNRAVLGGFTVLNHLAPGFVMAHFSLSLLILVAASALALRATFELGTRPRSTDGTAVRSVRGLIPLGALTIYVVATGVAHSVRVPRDRVRSGGSRSRLTTW
jgi:hypothetical protein